MALPKRFPDRDEISAVRVEAEKVEPGEEAGEPRRVAGRVMARRDMGKLVFLDLVDRSGKIQLLVAEDRAGPVDLDLGDIVGATGIPSQDEARRALARRHRARAARQDQAAAAGHLPRADRHRDALPPALPRPADERGVARRLRAADAHGHRDPPLPRRARLPRGRDADPPAPLRRRARRAVRDALERARHRPLPAHRDRALPQAPDRRRARARLRAGAGLPERERLLQARARVHHGRVVRGLCGLQRHDGPDRGARRDRRQRDDRNDEGHLPRARGRPQGALEARQADRRARGEGPLDAGRGRSPQAARGARSRHERRTTRGAVSSTTRSATSSSPS